MAATVSLDDQLLKQLQQTGEVQVEDIHVIPLVLMTVDARDRLQKLVYSDLTDGEMMALGAEQLDDPEGWGAPGMEVYDTMEGIDPQSNGSS